MGYETEVTITCTHSLFWLWSFWFYDGSIDSILIMCMHSQGALLPFVVFLRKIIFIFPDSRCY
jgi:hypothetical protein